MPALSWMVWNTQGRLGREGPQALVDQEALK